MQVLELLVVTTADNVEQTLRIVWAHSFSMAVFNPTTVRGTFKKMSPDLVCGDNTQFVWQIYVKAGPHVTVVMRRSSILKGAIKPSDYEPHHTVLLVSSAVTYGLATAHYVQLWRLSELTRITPKTSIRN